VLGLGLGLGLGGRYEILGSVGLGTEGGQGGVDVILFKNPSKKWKKNALII